MRTTITLEDDVAGKLRERARSSGRPFKDVVNEALRAGLAAESVVAALPPFTIEPQYLIRLKAGYNYDKVEEVFDLVDSAGRGR